MDRFLPADVRRWVYGVAIVAMPLLVFYGVVSESAAPLWVAAVGGILVPGLAVANVPSKVKGDVSDPG